VTGTLSAPLFVASFATSGVSHYILAAFAIICIYFAAERVWRAEYTKRIEAEGQLSVADTGGPVLVIEIPEPRLKHVYNDERVLILRNLGNRTATGIKIEPADISPYRFVFKEINALAPIGHRGDTGTVYYDAYKDGGILFGSNKFIRPAAALVLALEHDKGLADDSEIRLDIRFLDGRLSKHTTQIISYDQFNETAMVHGGNS